MKIQQGRTKYLTISLKKENGERFLLQAGDRIRFGVRPSYNADYIILKTLTCADEINGKYPLLLSSDDTNIPARAYLYDCSLECSDGSVYDIVKSDSFIVSNSVTFKGD